MHDANGQELKIGDRVWIEGVIAEVCPGAEVCNVRVNFDDPQGLGGNPCVWTNTRLFQKVENAENVESLTEAEFPAIDPTAQALEEASQMLEANTIH